MSTNNNKKKHITGLVRDELRRCISLYCLAAVFEKTGMKQQEQQNVMEEMFHGTETKTSQKQLMSQGAGT